MMGNIEKSTASVLFKTDYYNLIYRLVDENDSHQSILTLYEYYKGSNPFFLNNLKESASFLTGVELSELNNLDIIEDEEFKFLTDIIIDSSIDELNTEKIKSTLDEILRIELKNLKNFKLNDRSARISYARIFLDIISFIGWNKIHGEGENFFKILTINEKLYLLDALIKAKLLDKKGTSKELEVVLSLITGHNPVSLENPLTERNTWWNFYNNTSPYSIQTRIDSLNKIKDQLKVKKIKTGEIVNGIDNEINTAEIEKKTKEERKKTDKKNNRNSITKG